MKKAVDIRSVVDGFKTKHSQGFTQSEVKKLLKKFPGIDMKKFNDALMGNTCMMMDREIVHYHCDIEKAIYCGVEKRNLTVGEWD